MQVQLDMWDNLLGQEKGKSSSDIKENDQEIAVIEIVRTIWLFISNNVIHLRTSKTTIKLLCRDLRCFYG